VIAAPLLLDDHLLLAVLLDREPRGLRPRGAPIFTTGLWYHRMARAIAEPTVTGVMSRSLGGAGHEVSAGVVGAVASLPDEIGLISLRSLAWPMAELVTAGVRLNLLSLEALATAVHLDATIVLAKRDDNRPLREAATASNVTVRTITA
jgi:hypothetical protein